MYIYVCTCIHICMYIYITLFHKEFELLVISRRENNNSSELWQEKLLPANIYPSPQNLNYRIP